MTKYVLHGGFTGKENELNRTFYEEVARDIPDKSTVLLVYFASREADNSGKFKEDSDRFTAQSHGKHFNFVFATKEDFINQFKQADAAYFRGGSTNKLLKVLKGYPDFSSFLEGKTVAGSSAGAYALARFGTSHSDEAVREGLGLVPLRVVCHFESSELPPNAGSIVALQNTAQDLELVFLKDCEWKVFNY